MPVSATSPRAVLARYRAAMLAMDADALAELYAPDGVHEFPFRFPGFPARYEGRDAVRAGYGAAWAASPARPAEVEEVALHLTDDPEVLVVEQVVRGELAGGRGAFAVPGLLVLRVRDGLLVHVRDYMDGLAVSGARPS
ncbi:nuclear transport factor 2 family protein [Kitasatospora cineracea]|uniref:Ketosteroid isomerase-like protein n=1 Tax=Kitasatospora cineracea TaxID=88074 RepID=A0A3N4RU68_9ACTN|nr:nuclear transport factor 2 family protein [Kitasatospora cineracea]RPE36913.1 ketosteroid isomerase-like protein [Kitasatospora cineracea]